MNSLQIKLRAPTPTQMNHGPTLKPQGAHLKATPVNVRMMNWRTRIPINIGMKNGDPNIPCKMKN